MPNTLGTFPCKDCGCCEGSDRVFDDKNCRTNQMRCTGCGCTMSRRNPMTLRLYVNGSLTLVVVEEASKLARTLGGGDETLMVRDDNTGAYFYDIPTDGIQARLEIDALKKT